MYWFHCIGGIVYLTIVKKGIQEKDRDCETTALNAIENSYEFRYSLDSSS